MVAVPLSIRCTIKCDAPPVEEQTVGAGDWHLANGALLLHLPLLRQRGYANEGSSREGEPRG